MSIERLLEKLEMTATATSARPRYAPPDPTLPKPWKGLIDVNTDNLYFWNPVTNVTQYERPNLSTSVSSPVQRPQGQHAERDDGDKYNRSISSGLNKPSSGEGIRTARESSDTSQNGTSVPKSYSASGAASDISPEAYRRKHEISVTGGDVPPPLTSFEATGFPSELLREEIEDIVPDPTRVPSSSGVAESNSIGSSSSFQKQDNHKELLVDRDVGSPRLVKLPSTSTFTDSDSKEKYGPNGQGKASNGTPAKPTGESKTKPDVNINVGLSDSPPWVCSLCDTNATSKQMLLVHAEGKKHRAKAHA